MENNKTPKIRFKGFTDPWEQRKLGELVDRVVRKNTNNESTLPLTISAQYGLVDQIKYFNNRVASRDVSNYYLVLNGEFAYNKSTSDGYPFGAVKRLDLYEKGVLSTLYIVFVPKKEQQIDSDFLTVFFDTNRWHKGVAERAAEGARNHGLLNISAEDFFDIDLSVPKDVAEQKQIGAFIRQLDDLITLHQRKYNKLLNVKKSMLEKMFPKNGSNIPEIRFKGFTDPWEQRKLGELCNITTGKLDANAMVSDGQYDFYTSGIDVFKIDVAAFEGPAITIAGNGASVGYMHLADGKFNAYQRTYVLTDFLADRQFLNVAIGNELPDKIQEEVRGSGIPYIVLNMLTDLAIPFPSHEEQYAIGVYFQQLDNLITLHQRELEKLQNIKKSMLEKMFV